MDAVNISFNVPQSPKFSIDEFRRKMLEYSRQLISELSNPKPQKPGKGHRVLTYDELPPEVKELCGICKNSLPEWDLEGSTVRDEALDEEYGSDK